MYMCARGVVMYMCARREWPRICVLGESGHV
jgi:hypothetical protein